MSTVCLAMVCKNEAEFIARALRSAKPFIDRWVVVDTGSTDGTQDIIRAEMQGIPGTLHERPWLNWAHNRTEAVQLGKESGAEFVLILDADEKLLIPESLDLVLDPDKAYWVTIQYGSMRYARPNILSVKHNWHYVGVTHEYLTLEPDQPPAVLLPIDVETHPVRTNKTPEKCQLDADLLSAALKDEPDNARYVFYLAQSYRDSMQPDKAIEWYGKRASMGGWYEEVWYSLFQIGELKARTGAPEHEIIGAYLNAFDYNPRRAEALGALARWLRQKQRYHSALMFAERALATPQPDEKLFVETSYYTWLNLDEFAVAAFWCGRFADAAKACDKLLKVAPPQEHERIAKNRQFSLDKLGPQGS